jgi:hypothetical protein
MSINQIVCAYLNTQNRGDRFMKTRYSTFIIYLALIFSFSLFLCSSVYSINASEKLVTNYLKVGWEQAQQRFGDVIGKLSTPRLSVEENTKACETAWAKDISYWYYQTGHGAILYNKIGKKWIKILYPSNLKISQADALGIMAFAYLIIGLVDREYDPAAYFSFEAVTCLYSYYGLDKNIENCAKANVETALAIYFTNPNDPLDFLKKYKEGKTNEFIATTERYLGEGSWDAIFHAQANGSSELREICLRILKRKDKQELMTDFFKFMMDNFSLDATQVTVKIGYNKYIKLSEL